MAGREVVGGLPLSQAALDYLEEVEAPSVPMGLPLSPAGLDYLKAANTSSRPVTMDVALSDFDTFKALKNEGFFKSDLGAAEMVWEGGKHLVKDVGAFGKFAAKEAAGDRPYLLGFPGVAAYNFFFGGNKERTKKEEAKAKATMSQTFGNVGLNWEALASGGKRVFDQAVSNPWVLTVPGGPLGNLFFGDETTEEDLQSSYEFWKQSNEIEKQRTNVAAEMAQSDFLMMGVDPEVRELITSGEVKPDMPAAMGGALAADPVNWLPFGAAAQAAGVGRPLLTGANMALLNDTGKLLFLREATKAAARKASDVRVTDKLLGNAAAINRKIVENEAKLAPLARQRAVALETYAKQRPLGDSLRESIEGALEGAPAPGRTAPGATTMGATMVAGGKFAETLGGVLDFLSTVPAETAVTLLVKSGMPEEAAANVLGYVSKYGTRGAIGLGVVGLSDSDYDVLYGLGAALGPAFLSRFGRDFAIAGRQMMKAETRLPYITRLRSVGPERLVDQAIDRTTFGSTASSTFRRSVGAAEGGIGKRLFGTTDVAGRTSGMGTASSAVARFLDDTKLGRWAETGGRIAEGAAHGGAVGGGFGYVAGGGEMPEATLGGVGMGLVMGFGGGAFGQWNRFANPAQHVQARYGDLLYYRDNYLPAGEKEAFGKLPRASQMAVASKQLSHPDLVFHFVSNGKRGAPGQHYVEDAGTGHGVGHVEVNVDSPRAMEFILAHEVMHDIDARGGMQAFDDLFIGNVFTETPGLFSERVTEATKSLYPELEVGDYIIIGEAGNPRNPRRYKTNEEFEKRREEYGEAIGATEGVGDVLMTDERVVREMVVEHGTDYLLYDKRRYRDLHEGPVGAVMRGLMQTELVNNRPLLKKMIGIMGGGFRPDGGLASPNAIFKDMQRIPEVTELVRKYNMKLEGVDPETRAKKFPYPEEASTIKVEAADIAKQPELLDLMKAGTLLRVDKDGKVSATHAMTPRERGKYNRDFSAAVMVAIAAANERGELTEGHVRPIETATGETRFEGRYISKAVIDAVEKQGIWNKEQIDLLRRVNEVLETGEGNEFLMAYFKATPKGGGRYVNASVQMVTEVPYGIEVSKKGNVLIRTVNVDQLVKNIEKLFRTQPAEMARLYGADEAAAKYAFREDLDLYHRNHAEGRPGEYLLDADPALAEQKRNLINSLFGEGRKTQLDANPWLAGLGKKAPRPPYRSRRLERIGKVTQLSGKRHVNYEKIARNLLPAPREGAPGAAREGEGRLFMPWREEPYFRGDIPKEEFLEKGAIREGVKGVDLKYRDVPEINEQRPAIYLSPDPQTAYYFATSIGYENVPRRYKVDTEKTASREDLNRVTLEEFKTPHTIADAKKKGWTVERVTVDDLGEVGNELMMRHLAAEKGVKSWWEAVNDSTNSRLRSEDTFPTQKEAWKLAVAVAEEHSAIEAGYSPRHFSVSHLNAKEVAALKKAGYDSIEGEIDLPTGGRELAVFSEKQLKLAPAREGERLFMPAEEAGAPKGKNVEAARLWEKKGTDSPYFKKWFGKSKVVDEEGNPLVVYHGTKADFTEFKRSKGGEFGSGMYFSDNPDSARMFGGFQSGSAEVITMPVYLSLKNPLITNDRNIPRGAGIKSLMKKGYDGVIGTTPNGQKQYIAFEPTQIKSATGNRGTFDPTDPNRLFMPAGDRPLGLSDNIRDVVLPGIRQDKFSRGQLEAALGKTAGARAYADEIGLIDWLGDKKSVTKGEVDAFVDANAPRLEEKLLGEATFNKELNIWQHQFDWMPDGEPKFSEYQEPGGTNYREVLVKLPREGDKVYTEENVRPIDRPPDRPKPRGMDAGNWYFDTPAGIMERPKQTVTHPQGRPPQIKSHTQAEALQYILDNRQPPSTKNFRETHFNEDNVLLHLRLNDRIDADGKKVMFIEELQSQWHQKGRKEGYVQREWNKGDLVAERTKVGTWSITIRGTRVIAVEAKTRSEAIDVAWKRLQEGESELHPMDEGTFGEGKGVPDAPFKKNWPALGLKRAIREAIEGGYDRIAWLDGEGQAARYDLSKRISKIDYSEGILDGKFQSELRAYDLDGRLVIQKEGVTPEQLPDYIGKEGAEKLLAKKPKDAYWSDSLSEYRNLSDLDLKVGGEGMKAFYDRELVSIANKISKKIGGEKVTSPPWTRREISDADFGFHILDLPKNPQAVENLRLYMPAEKIPSDGRAPELIYEIDKKGQTMLPFKKGFPGKEEEVTPYSKLVDEQRAEAGEPPLAEAPPPRDDWRAGNVRSKGAWGRDKLYMPALEDAKAMVKERGRVAEAAEEIFWGIMMPEILKKTKGQLKPSVRNLREAARRGVKDVEEFLRKNPRLADFYDADIIATKAALDEYFAQLSDDDFLFYRVALGLTSPATGLSANVGDAVNVLNLRLDRGHLDDIVMGISPKGNRVVKDSPFLLAGTTAPNKAFSLKIIDRLAKEKGGMRKAVDFLEEWVTPKELNKFNRDMGYKGSVRDIGPIKALVKQATGQDKLVPRMFIFGKKVGAFTLNMLGDHAYNTIDVWEARFIRSYFKGMFDDHHGLPANVNEHKFFQRYTEIFKEEFEKAMKRGAETSALQALRWYYMIDAAKQLGYSKASTNETISVYTRQHLSQLGANPKSGRPNGQTPGEGVRGQTPQAPTGEEVGGPLYMPAGQPATRPAGQPAPRAPAPRGNRFMAPAAASGEGARLERFLQ